MKSRTILSLLAVLALVCATLLVAQQISDVAGAWLLTTTFTLEGEAAGEAAGSDCDYQGLAEVTQDGLDFGGEASLELVAGGSVCPEQMTAQLTGQILMAPPPEDHRTSARPKQIGPVQLTGELTSPEFGVASFFGGLAKVTGPLSGGTFVTSSPLPALAGATGDWMAVPRQAAVEIPTLGGAALALLAVLLLAAGFLYLRRRPA